MREPPGLLAAAAGYDAIGNGAAGQLFHRARRQLLLARRRAVPRELVQHARMLGRDQHAEVLVWRLRAANDVTGCKDTHSILTLVKRYSTLQFCFQSLHELRHLVPD